MIPDNFLYQHLLYCSILLYIYSNSHLGNNGELEKKHTIMERLVAKQRLEYNEAESSRLQFQDELETLKYTVDRTAADLETLRGNTLVSIFG